MSGGPRKSRAHCSALQEAGLPGVGGCLQGYPGDSCSPRKRAPPACHPSGSPRRPLSGATCPRFVVRKLGLRDPGGAAPARGWYAEHRGPSTFASAALSGLRLPRGRLWSLVMKPAQPGPSGAPPAPRGFWPLSSGLSPSWGWAPCVFSPCEPPVRSGDGRQLCHFLAARRGPQRALLPPQVSVPYL